MLRSGGGGFSKDLSKARRLDKQLPCLEMERTVCISIILFKFCTRHRSPVISSDEAWAFVPIYGEKLCNYQKLGTLQGGEKGARRRPLQSRLSWLVAQQSLSCSAF